MWNRISPRAHSPHLPGRPPLWTSRIFYSPNDPSKSLKTHTRASSRSPENANRGPNPNLHAKSFPDENEPGSARRFSTHPRWPVTMSILEGVAWAGCKRERRCLVLGSGLLGGASTITPHLGNRLAQTASGLRQNLSVGEGA